MAKQKRELPEFALVGDVDQWEGELIKDLLALKPGSHCSFYIDSSGGSVYGAMAILTLIKLRKLNVTCYVLGECSSAMLLIFAISQKRFVTPYSTLFFHRMRWQSDKRVDSVEAKHWAAHFLELEEELQNLEARLFGADSSQQIRQWINQARFLTGRQVAQEGLAELVEI